MIDLQRRWESVNPDISEVQEWADSQYEQYFSQYFKHEVELYNKMKSTSSTITDSELEWILTSLPLELFSVAEQISRLKTAQEVIKLYIKDKEAEYVATADQTISVTKRKEDAAIATSGDRLLVTVFNAIVERVEREVSFSRELIMSAKKIWDARRSKEGFEPSVDISGSELPEYVPQEKKYIK